MIRELMAICPFIVTFKEARPYGRVFTSTIEVHRSKRQEQQVDSDGLDSRENVRGMSG